MDVYRRTDSSRKLFMIRTVAAQLHLIGALGALVGLFFLMYAQGGSGSLHFFLCLIFGLTGIAVFAVSAFYHFVHDGFRISPALELKLESADHIAIFLFIAGTYSPILLNTLTSNWKWILLGGIWGLCFFGVAYTLLKDRMPKWAQLRGTYVALFVAMGWLLIVRIGEILAHLSASGVWLLMGGAAAYTVGAIIYAVKRPDPFPGLFGFHELWHFMVIVGFACHYFLILSMYH